MNRSYFHIAFVIAVASSGAMLVAAEPAAPPFIGEVGKPISLFDGQTLGGWKVTPFGGEGEVHVDDGVIVLETGNDMTGITWTKSLPTMDYEITLEAMRVSGGDFFCGLTFPVNDKPCSLIVGGWGGGTVGLSSIDDGDASENETTTYHSFKDDRWYAIRLRVTKEKIEAWIDKEKIVDLKTKDRRISIRSEVELSRPLGISTWNTTGAVRKIQLTPLPPSP
jgi:hypothetical protein